MPSTPAPPEPARLLLHLWEERFGVLAGAHRRQFLEDATAEAIARFPLYRICGALDHFGPKLRTVLDALETMADASPNLSPAADRLASNMDLDLKDKAQRILEAISGPDASFRPGQWEAIEDLVYQRRRVIVVQRTGWGKSAVYLISTRLNRDLGAGPTLIVSPLLALMRNQLEMASRAGILDDELTHYPTQLRLVD